MRDFHVEEVFTAAGVNARSHCLAACRYSDNFVFASDGELIVHAFPGTSCGHVTSVSRRHHKGPITVLKRVSCTAGHSDQVDLFLSGGADGRVVVYGIHAADPTVLHLITLQVSGGIGALCGTSFVNKLVVAAAWVDGTNSGLRVYWLEHAGNGSLSVIHLFDVEEHGSMFAVAADMQIMSNGSALLALGTTKRSIDLYCETPCGREMKRVLSITAHDDWIHSLSFNQSFPILLATAGQDSYVKLWRIEEETEAEDLDQISVTKNIFKVESGDTCLSMAISAEAVLTGHDDWVHSTSWDTTGRTLLTSSSDKTVIVWRETVDEKLWSDAVRLGIVGGQAAGFYSADFSGDGSQIVASSYFGGLYAWISKTEQMNVWDAAAVHSGHVGALRDVAWDSQGKMLFSVGEDRTSRVFVPQKKDEKFIEIARPQVHGHSMQCITVVSSSVIVTGAEEKIFRAFQAPLTFAKSVCNVAGYGVTELFGDSSLPHYGARVPALGLSNKAIENVEDATEEDDAPHWEEGAFQASPAELNAPPTEDCLQQNTLWPEVQKLYGHGYEVYAAATNPSGTVMATSCKSSQMDDAAIVLWDTSDWSKKSEILGHQLTVTQLEWSPDGTRLLSVGRDRKAMLHLERNGDLNGFCYEKVWSSNKEHSRIIWSCSWFADSQHFVTASRDMQVMLWESDEEGASPVCAYRCAQPATAVAACGSNDAIIAVGLQDGSVLLLSKNGDHLDVRASLFAPAVPVDSAITRIRVNPVKRDELAVAGTDGKLRLLRLRYGDIS